MRPGDGEEFVHSPVGVNATLHCTVNNTLLEWEIDGYTLDSAVRGPQLNSRGIFQSGPTTSSDGVTFNREYGELDSPLYSCKEGQAHQTDSQRN